MEQVQKQIPKSTGCLTQYIDVVHTLGQQFLPIVKNVVFYTLMPGRKLDSFITTHVCPILRGFGKRIHIIQIVGSVEGVGIVPLLACEVG